MLSSQSIRQVHMNCCHFTSGYNAHRRNQRTEIIVELPEGTDVTPILGAHSWRNFLNLREVADRTSYIFEYNYKNKGRPEERKPPSHLYPKPCFLSHSNMAHVNSDNWYENHLRATGEPPPSLKFPVKYPYPRPSWASPFGKSCRDIARPLPSSRIRTPPPSDPQPTPVWLVFTLLFLCLFTLYAGLIEAGRS